MADADKTLELLIKLGVVGKEDVQAANDLLTQTTKATSDFTGGTKTLGEEVGKTTERFSEHRREIRSVFNELGEAAGVGRVGGLALGGIFAAATAAVGAIRFLGESWKTLKETINGPIEIGIPPTAPATISAAAEAWNAYAEARAKVIASQNSPEANASAREKELANELKLIKEVMAAEKEKALAHLEQQKSAMSPELFAAAKANIDNIFGAAGKSADEKNAQSLVANKYDEAFGLEVDARAKMQEALGVKRAPQSTEATISKFLDEQAAKATQALAEINERIAFVHKVANPDGQSDYTGPAGLLQKNIDRARYIMRYGGTEADFKGNLANEEQRKAQAEAVVETARTYKEREEAAQKRVEDLTRGAGEESGRAAGLRKEASGDSKYEQQQKAVNDHVGRLHESAASSISGATSTTVMQLQKVLDSTLGGFFDIHATLIRFDQKLEQMRLQHLNSRNNNSG